jgi:hypothetical protein
MVAIYAIVAYNYFVARVNAIAVQYRLFTEEFLMALSEHGPVRPGQTGQMAAARIEAAPVETPPGPPADKASV